MAHSHSRPAVPQTQSPWAALLGEIACYRANDKSCARLNRLDRGPSRWKRAPGGGASLISGGGKGMQPRNTRPMIDGGLPVVGLITPCSPDHRLGSVEAALKRGRAGEGWEKAVMLGKGRGPAGNSLDSNGRPTLTNGPEADAHPSFRRGMVRDSPSKGGLRYAPSEAIMVVLYPSPGDFLRASAGFKRSSIGRAVFRIVVSKKS